MITCDTGRSGNLPATSSPSGANIQRVSQKVMPSVFYLQSSSTCEEENAFLTGKSYSLSSAVTGA